MPDNQISPCKACQALVLWAITDIGKWAPFDVKPTKQYMLKKDDTGRWHATAVAVYTSHFATCPKAGEFRKPKQIPMEDHHERRDLD